MYKHIIQCVAAIGITALFAVTAAAKCSDADRAALEKFDRDWGDYATAKDRPALEKIYSDQFAGFGLTSITDKKSAVDGAMNAPPAPENQEVSYDHYLISCTPKSAVVTHRVVVRTKDGNNERVAYARSVHFLERSGNTWQLVGNTGHAMDDNGTIIYQEISGYHAYMNRDAGWFEKNTDDNYIGVSLGGEAMSKTSFIEAMKADNTKYSSVQLSDINMNVDGKLAVISGLYTVKGQSPDGATFETRFRFTRTLVNKYGNWVAVAGHASILSDN